MAPPLSEAVHTRSQHLRLTEIFSSTPPGRDDAPALQEVRQLCMDARRRIHDAHCDAQLRQLERYARFFFSREAHEQWARDTGFGGTGLRGLVLQVLSGIELRLSHLEAQRLSAGGGAQTALRVPAANSGRA
jgi:hypothetical protein